MGIAVEDVVVKSRLLQYGHIIYQGTKTQIHEVLQFEMARKRRKGRPRKMCINCIRGDMEILRLSKEDMEDREYLRNLIQVKSANPAQDKWY